MTDKVRVSHILCKHTGSRNPVSRRTCHEISISHDEALKEIKDMIEKLKADKRIFSEMAKARSDCGSYKNGGDLGFFDRGEMQRPFEDVAFSLKIGELSGPVETDSGVSFI
ncbi:peptidyl-prolyl cis-trans isomerase ESS1, putative [Perkinsus marinus ATCC 50983]|uniref:Peptidyl-prolyl cis-trans isomerase n=1 Tax=Perkinsus marinus (strain ATCC 50983 / TXsc) TaxID=423536 RepID=C5KVX1_PERM5|nr:peptidyl-prolyl cis-trans isomerase ESS1, putative [Perkinsus marinus ATCC 50983]EER11362.1 peptidyl-prolyl cis-trans isomerase ESS1, putative [Perkinsus marinus ATCC 50983]|eukprot:XP_002779567.1 peptidyl-prolyl cis-trans isomerase ESS1, putative [Perkinsus marinus ATCC 50983]